MENTSLVPRRFRLGWENTFNSQKHGKILSTYAENTLYCSDVYNLAQKLNNSIRSNCQDYWSCMTEESCPG